MAPRIDWHGLHEYLYYNTALGARTLYAGVSKLLPGHKLTLDVESGLNIGPYCSIFDVEPVADDFATAAERVRALLDRAVRDHLVSDVPVGVFLSGGIDSSAITAFASRHYRGRLSTYSAGFDFEGERSVNELPKARLVAEHFGTDHHELHVAGGDVASVIERLVGHHDAPFGDAANIPLYLLCEQLGGAHKVILQGDGGDEIFAGYRDALTHGHRPLGPHAGSIVFLGGAVHSPRDPLLPIVAEDYSSGPLSPVRPRHG